MPSLVTQATTDPRYDILLMTNHHPISRSHKLTKAMSILDQAVRRITAWSVGANMMRDQLGWIRSTAERAFLGAV